MKDLILTTKSVTHHYDKAPALKQVNLQIEKGQIYGLVGNNGSGKTTLMRLIVGQTRLQQGNVTLFGASDEKALQQKRRKIGALIEAPGYFDHLSAAENLEYFRIQFGIPDKNMVHHALSLAGIAGTGKKKYKDFSLGMKQRLGIAGALLNSPELLILDEPINGLDPSGVVEIRNTLLEINQESGVTILITSHILSELANVATHYGFLRDGQLVEQISADNLYAKCLSGNGDDNIQKNLENYYLRLVGGGACYA